MITGLGSGNFNVQDAATMRKQMFQKLDQNSDGKITQDELEANKPKDGRGPDAAAVLAQADTNQDGAIDEAENDVFLQQAPPPPPKQRPDPAQVAQKLFASLDANKDDAISTDELASALKDADSDINAKDVFAALDTDEDGSITQSELEAALAKVFEKLAAREARGVRHHHGYDKSGEVASDSQAGTSSFTAVA